MNYKFIPDSLLVIFVFITLFYHQKYFIMVDHANNLHDKRRIQTEVTQVDNNHKADDVNRTILALKHFQKKKKKRLNYMVLYIWVVCLNAIVIWVSDLSRF